MLNVKKKKDEFACPDVMDYSTVTLKDSVWILEMVKPINMMLHELIKNANSYAWA